MSIRTFLVVTLALVFGLSAAMAVNRMINMRASAGPVQTVPVVTAVVGIARGEAIAADQVTTSQFPSSLVPRGALSKVEDAINRGVFIPLVPGEPVLEAKLAPRGAGRGLAALVPSGMRAFTITTPNVASGVAGFVLPGNRVDVLLTL